MRTRASAIAICALVVLAACQKQTPASSTSPSSSAAPASTPTQMPEAAPSLPAQPQISTLSQSCDGAPSGDQCMLSITGEISPGLERQISQALARITSTGGRVFAFTLDSPGGDLNEALKIGQLLRSNELLVAVPRNSICYSSCVLVFAGGVSRSPLGTIGIHRPYFAGGAASTSDARSAYSSIRAEVVEFLQDGGISSSLWDDMLAIPPEEIRELSFPELERYGLLGNDPSYEEKKARQQMQWYGIDRVELNRRISEGKRECAALYPSDMANRVMCAQTYIQKGHP